jgi:hypothetical protein
VPRSTLQKRVNGRLSRVNIPPNGRKLTDLEEESLIKWIFSIDKRGAAPRKTTIREMANILLAARGSYPPPTVGLNWLDNFIDRRPEFRMRALIRYNY